MKTTKLMLLVALMALATIGFGQLESSPRYIDKPAPSISVEISLQSAMHNATLVDAMHAQLNPSFLKVDRPVYTRRVQVKNVFYYISGSYYEWSKFFNIKPAQVTVKKD